MNRPIKRGCMEVYNDYNSNLTNLFFCVKERPLALITELGFLPLNSRDDFDAIYRQLKCEEFDDEYLAIVNETRFSNIFIEKRVSSCLQSLERSRLFPFDVLTHKRKNSRNAKPIFLRKAAI